MEWARSNRNFLSGCELGLTVLKTRVTVSRSIMSDIWGGNNSKECKADNEWRRHWAEVDVKRRCKGLPRRGKRRMECR